MKFSENTIVYRDPDLLFSHLDDEVVMLNMTSGEYFGLNKVGSRIWQLIEKPVSIAKLMEKLMEEYEVAKEACFTDVCEFLTLLDEKKMIHINE